MDRFVQVLGLDVWRQRANERHQFCLPLTREAASLVRAAMEGRPQCVRERALPGCELTILQTLECLVVRSGRSIARYLLAGELAALRRVLLIETPMGLGAALDELGLSALFRAPSHDEVSRHGRAMASLRDDPRRVARWWVDGERWPPEASAFGEGQDRPIDEPGPSALARRLRSEGELLALEVLVRSPESVASILRQGLVPARWRLWAGGAPEGLSPERDLRSGGASFVFARMLRPERLGHPLPEGIEYSVLIDAGALDSEPRFILREERAGSLHALAESRSDHEIEADLRTGRWPAHHEILFPFAVPPAFIRGVQCRSGWARDRLLAGSDPVSTEIWLGESRRWPGSGREMPPQT